MQNIKLAHYSPENGIALTRIEDNAFSIAPPYDEGSLSPLSSDLQKSKNELSFESIEALKLFLQFKNALYVAANVNPFIKKESLRPETITGLDDLKEMLESIIKCDLSDKSVSGKAPIALQLYRTIFGGEDFSRENIMSSHKDLLTWEGQESSERLLIMAGHEKFDYVRWIIPTIVEIEHDWLPQEKFQDVQNLLLFVSKFLGLNLSKSSEKSLKQAYAKVSELARIQKFIKDGRHKVKDWQKSARFIR